MGLNASQQQQARQVYSTAVLRGVPPARARELASAALAESGLNPAATNKSSGAAGLFQLLSSGYVNTAKKLGGVYNPQANLLSILPSYQRYWQQHPHAAPGDAGRDVERSGMGSGFYSRGLDQLGFLAGSAPGASGAPVQGLAAGRAANAPVGPSEAQRRAFALAMVSSPHLSTDTLLQALHELRQPNPAAQSPPAPMVPAGSPSAQYAGDPSGGKTLTGIEKYAAPYGLTVTSTTGGQHAEHSYHYQGRAVDFGGDPRRMAALAQDAARNPGQWKEMFYSGPGNPGVYIKNGKAYPLDQLDPGLYAEHQNHVHLAR